MFIENGHRFTSFPFWWFKKVATFPKGDSEEKNHKDDSIFMESQGFVHGYPATLAVFGYLRSFDSLFVIVICM